MDSNETERLAYNTGRRGLMRGAGAAALVAMTGVSSIPLLTGSAEAQALTDVDILNFALNLEYLEAEFYLRASLGRGLLAKDVTGTGTPGAVTGGMQPVPFTSTQVRQFAAEVAVDEERHVQFLRSALGSARVARPAINLGTAFTAAARAAGLITAPATFNPFASETNFLIAAYIFEDVGVTAYKGAARFIQNKDYLEAAAGILAVEAYHAGAIRTLMIGRGLTDAGNKISDLRDAVDGASDLDEGLTQGTRFNVVPTDPNAIAFSRTPAQVANIVYLGGGANNFGFFPNKLNGTIK